MLFTGRDECSQEPEWYNIFKNTAYWEIDNKRPRIEVYDSIYMINIKEYLNIANPKKKTWAMLFDK